MRAVRCFAAVTMLAVSPWSFAVADVSGNADDPDHRAVSPQIAGDRLIFKLTADAARRADDLPERGLPVGLHELGALLGRNGLSTGVRAVHEHGTPVGDRELFKRTGLDRVYVVHLPRPDPRRVRELVRLFRAQPWIEYAEPVSVLHPQRTVPDDPRFAEQWPPDNGGQTGGTPDADIDGPEAWDIETGDAAIVIAVLDTGVDQDHEDLVDNLLPGYDFGDDDPDPEDNSDHGTRMTGVAAARGNNATGVAGVCWNCSVMPLKIYPDSGSATTDILVDAIRYAADNGASVINMSFVSGPAWQQSLVDAVDYALGLGTLPLAAAGNSGLYLPNAPAYYPNVVAVGGTDHHDARLYDYGEHLDVSAPSDGALSTNVNNSYAVTGGTSAATAHASGLAALLRSHDPGLHVNELRHLLRLGAEDGVGAPGEDPPGWDRFMGSGRINVPGSLAQVDGPWLALDRAHYVCAGQLTVSLKDKTAGAAVDVLLTGDLGGDSESVTVTPVTADGYFEGSILLSWAGKDGPVVIDDGSLDIEHGETITATAGTLTATAFLECSKRVCVSGRLRPQVQGDCDHDGAADPGEVWTLGLPLFSDQTELMEQVVAVLSTTDSDVEVLDDTVTYGNVQPMLAMGTLPDADGSNDPFRFRLRAGVPADVGVAFDVTIRGLGWEADNTGCDLTGNPNAVSLPTNRDLGATLSSWGFDDGTLQGFGHEVAHGTGDLPECDLQIGSWGDHWNDVAASDRSHSGGFSLRLGTGGSYQGRQDAGLVTPAFTVDGGGGALGFYLWMDAAPAADPRFAQEGMIVEIKRIGDTIWSYLSEVTYNADLETQYCFFRGEFPFGTSEQPDLFSGDGGAGEVEGDAFDRRHQVDLTAFAGDTVQVRLRFGTNRQTTGVGVWIDTVSVHGPFMADGWTGAAPGNLQGSGVSCPTSFDLSWDAVAGAGAYDVYRSEVSCLDAAGSPDVYGTSITSQFSDPVIVEGVEYYYAVEATQSGTGCPTERTCLAGGCSCSAPQGPSGLTLERDGDDLILTWGDPGPVGVRWNVYREATSSPAGWGSPHASSVEDEDPDRPGVQYSDTGAASAGSLLFYRITAVSGCGESSLFPG